MTGSNPYAGSYAAGTKKMYPAFFCGGTFEKGLSFEGLGVRIPLRKYDPDLTAMAWYWLGEDIILMLDSHKVVNKDIELPSYMNGMHLEVLDSKNVETPILKGCKLSYYTGANDYGYLVVKLSKQSHDINLYPEEGNF